VNTCPVCRTKDITVHCHPTKAGNARHPTCHWFHCSNCGAVLDPQNRRGVDHKQRRIHIEGSR
jgi:hypothetical protein